VLATVQSRAFSEHRKHLLIDPGSSVLKRPVNGDFSATLLEAVMNSIRNSLGMRESEIAREPSRLWNPHFYAIFAQVHNTL
jgi:hypothetical protein